MKLATLAALAAFTVAGFAQAATVSNSDTTGFVGTDFTSTATPGLNILAPLELDLFDGSLGTLTSVEIAIEATFEASGTLNNLGSAGEFSFAQSVDVMATPNIGGIGGVSIGLSAVNGPIVFAPAESQVVLLTDTGTSSTTTGPAGFTGPGTFTIDFSTLSGSTVSGGGNLLALISTEALVSATVTYTFDDGSMPQVPLPASAPLLLAALGGLGFLSRRRRG